MCSDSNGSWTMARLRQSRNTIHGACRFERKSRGVTLEQLGIKNRLDVSMLVCFVQMAFAKSTISMVKAKTGLNTKPKPPSPFLSSSSMTSMETCQVVIELGKSITPQNVYPYMYNPLTSSSTQ